jgi:hypothetical protein
MKTHSTYVSFLLNIIFSIPFAIIGGVVALFTFLTFWSLLIGLVIGIVVARLTIWIDKRSGALWSYCGIWSFVGYLIGFAAVAGFMRTLLRL